MIKSVNNLALRFFRENKFIVFSSIIGVMLSIIIINTLLLFIIDGKQSLVDDVQQQYGEMDLSVGYDPSELKHIDSDLMHEILSDDIDAYSKVLISYANIDKIDGEVLVVGVENDRLAKSRFHFNSELDREDIIINERLAENLGVQLGDSITLEEQTYTIKEVTNAESPTEEMQEAFILMSWSSVQELEDRRTGEMKEATQILIKLHSDSDLFAYIDKLRQLDSAFTMEVAQADSVEQVNLSLLNQFIIVLSVLILVVTSLIMISNFDIFLYKYKNQFAIMRSIGASTKQVFSIILLQTLFINIIGAASGLLLTLLSYHFLRSWMEKIFSISVAHTGLNFGITLVVTISCIIIIQLFMLYPSVKSTKILPMIVMQDNEMLDIPYRNVIKWTGILAIMFSMLLLLLGVLSNNMAMLTLLGMLFLLVGFYCFIPIYLSNILKMLLAMINRLFGRISYLAVKNLIPQVRKNIFIILSISVMITISTFGSTFMRSIQINEQEYIKNQYPTDIVIQNEFEFQSNVDRHEVKEEIEQLNDVKNSSMQSLYYAGTLQKGNQSVSFDYAFAETKEMVEQGLLSPFKWEDNGIILEEQFARMNGIKVGDRLEVNLINQEYETISGNLVVVSIVKKMPEWGDALIDWDNSMVGAEDAEFGRAFIQTDQIDNTMNQLVDMNHKYPELYISNINHALEQSNKMFVQRWYIFIIVLIIIIFSVLLGVVNTLINSFQMKRKEFAVLRAVSLTNRGLRRYILTQVFLYLSIGLVSGFIIGVILIYAIRLIDPVPIYFDITLLLGITFSSLFVIFSVLLPIINKIGKSSLMQELTRDNK
ncbi:MULTISPECIES: FtsX-like permease family protein [Clostridia]|uniref:FtsX-like permease family protein n=1 Tax=Clostridia TaxID=186801 RepID=UPI001314A231|nr:MULTISPECIES: FtsX-like permease family protein [Clostridia]